MADTDQADKIQPPSLLRRDIEWMANRGSSLTMNWGEDTGCWEVAWITNGERFCGNSESLDDALYCARIAARNKLGSHGRH